MVIDFSMLGVIKEQPTLVLCNADGKALQTLGYAFNLKADICYNEASTITFDIPAYVDGKATPHYDDIVGMRIIDMSGWGRFILMNPSANNNGVTEIKSCKAYSLEYELTYKKVFFDESTYNLWDPFAPDNTVLGMIMEDLPSWTVGHVDADLIGRYRTFSASNVNVYNFMKSTLQKSYGCIFDFDTYTRTINVRSTANEAISKPVYLSMENLVKEIEISEDTENIFTVLDVSGGEDVDIRSVNPLGTNKIYNLDYFMTPSYFDQVMIDKWNAWKKSFEAYQLTYYNISVERMLIASAITTEQAKLNDIQSSDLGTLLNERAVYVEYLAQLSDKGSAEYANFQSKLDDVNARIAVANQSVSEQESVIVELQSRSSELNEQLASIKNAVSFSSVFTPSELIILDRYFKEESIEESTFVVSEVDSYNDENTSNAISKINVKISDGQLSEVSSEASDMIYAIKGGTLSFTSNGTSLTAGVVKAHIERRTDGTFIMSAFLNQGRIGDTTFPSGNISITGSSTSLSESGNVVNLAVSAGQMYFTRNATDYEKQSVAWDLFEYGKETLASLAYPSYTFNVSSGNFMSMDEFVGFVRQLELGQRIYLNTDKNVLEPIFIGVEIDFENLSSLELKFSDKYSSSDSSFKLVELLDQSISMGKTVDTNKLTYSAFVESGASTKVKEFMDSALDVAKNAILSSTGQGVSWDDTGFHLRKYLDSSNQSAGFEDEEIWMINNSIVFTDDGWQTAKMAIGKIIDENIAKYPESSDIVFNSAKTYYFLNDDGNYQVWDGDESDWANRPILYEKNNTAYGIVAPYIVGTILAGQNLVITTETGDFRVDSSGVHIDSMRFYITHGGSTGDTTLEDALTKTENDLANFIKNTYTPGQEQMENLIDGRINTFYQADAPSGYVVGRISGNSALALARSRVGDLWYDISDSDSKPVNRYTETSTGVFAWVEETSAENELFDLIDTKKTVFISTSDSYTPPTPYHEGDLWYQGSYADGEMMVCIKDKLSSQTYSKSDWKVSSETSGYIADQVSSLEGMIDGKADTYYQANAPHGEFTTATDDAEKNVWVGDLWYDTTQKKSFIYTKSRTADGKYSYTWEHIEAVPDELYDKVDTKRQVFTSQPKPPYEVGDLWSQGENGDLMRCIKARASGNYVASDWGKASKYTDDSALNTFIDGEYADDIKDIQKQMDGKAETWYQADDPSAAWNTAELKALHKGDLWFETDNAETPTKIWNGASWEAQSVPKEVFDQIDGKAQVFVSTPVPPYNVGDLWVQGSTGEIMRCKTARSSGTYRSSDWEKASKYTDDSALNKFISGAYADKVAELQGQVDGKAATYYQSTMPHPEYTSVQDNATYNTYVGDLWYNTTGRASYVYAKELTDSANNLYKYSWKTIEAVPDELYDKVDTKRQVFVSTPTPPYEVGDLWVQGSTGDIMRCKTARASGSYVSSDWTKASKYTDDTALNTFKNTYIENGYLNASKVKGVINSITTDMANGKGNVLFDNDGIWLMNGTQKSNSTKAIWMNESGIMLGSGTATSNPASSWDWTTAIGHDGIVSDAIAGKKISGIEIYGGSINIGNGKFTVDSNGNLVATSGIFSGTLDAPVLKGSLNASNTDAWLVGCGINVGNGKFYVDKSGNVTMAGSINMSSGSITWSSSNSPVKVMYSYYGYGTPLSYPSYWHDSFYSSDLYASYSYDGGSTWTSAVQIRGINGINGRDGQDGADGRDGVDGSDANVTFRNVNSALGTLFKTWSGGTPTSITSAYIYSPSVKGGTFYGSTFVAGDGSGYSQMNANGFNVFDEDGYNKIGLGYYQGNYSYPYLSLGIGSGTYGTDAGLVAKFQYGIWIGTSNVLGYIGYHGAPPSGDEETDGIFINFNTGKIYQYLAGVRSEIGSGSGGGTAVFG